MRSDQWLARLFSVSALVVMIAVGANAQKHGKGGRDGGGGDHGGQKHDRGDEDRGNRGGGERSGDDREDRGRHNGWQKGGGRENRGDERPQRQEPRQWQQVERQQQQRVYVPQQQVYVQPNRDEFRRQRGAWGQMRRQENFEAKRDRDDFKRERREGREAWKFERKQQHFEQKQDRHAGRDFGRNYRQYSDDRDRRNSYNEAGRVDQYNSYQPRYRSSYPVYREYRQDYQNYSQPGYRSYNRSQTYAPYRSYGDQGYTDQGYNENGNRWVEQLIRSVISSFFSSGADGGYYDDYSNDLYSQSSYADNGYEPQYGYSQPVYNTFGYPPTSAYYEPATYYGYDQYANEGLPYETLTGSLPYNDVRDIYSGGLAGEMIQRAMGTGYYQGLLEGQQARERGWGDQHYSDPYLYEQAIYDPYSTSLGDSRRYFSEGYEMGYEDALSGQDEFDLAGGGAVDLVSLLLGSVLSLRG